MPIRFKCPECQKPLSVKEHLAGKKAACPACKKPIRIPAPVSAAADVEDLAASTFTDAPKSDAPPPPPPKTLSFTCAFCDEKVEVSVELAGKQTPCPNPECGRIIKVPLLKQEKAKDWRNVNSQGPAAALRRGEEEPEGAWGSTTSRGRVSQQSLVEADAYPVEREPVSVLQWLKRGVLAATVVAVVVLAWLGIRAYMAQGVQSRALAKALEGLEPSSKLSGAFRAELQRAAGEYFVHANEPIKASTHFQNARDVFTSGDPKDATLAGERDLFLIDLAVVWVELGGTEDDIRSKTRLEWSDVHKELVRTIVAIEKIETRLIGVREVASKLIQKGQAELAANLAVQVSSASEKKAPETPPDGEEKTPQPSVVVAQQIALFLANDDKEKAASIRAAPSERDAKIDRVARLGYAEGLARQGNFEEAQRLATAKGTPEHRLESCVAVAIVALARDKPEAARASAETALQLETEMRKNKQPLAGPLRLLLVRAAVRSGLADQARPVLEAIQEKAIRSRAQLELFLDETRSNPEPIQLSAIDSILKDKETVGYALAVENASRINTKRGQRSDFVDTPDSLDERLLFFVQIGIALGVQDSRR